MTTPTKAKAKVSGFGSEDDAFILAHWPIFQKFDRSIDATLRRQQVFDHFPHVDRVAIYKRVKELREALEAGEVTMPAGQPLPQFAPVMPKVPSTVDVASVFAPEPPRPAQEPEDAHVVLEPDDDVRHDVRQLEEVVLQLDLKIDTLVETIVEQNATITRLREIVDSTLQAIPRSDVDAEIVKLQSEVTQLQIAMTAAEAKLERADPIAALKERLGR